MRNESMSDKVLDGKVAIVTGAGGGIGRAVAIELAASTCVVNNAGILRDRFFHKMSVDEFDAVIKVHLYGSLLRQPRGCQPLQGAGQRCLRAHDQHLGADRQLRPGQLQRRPSWASRRCQEHCAGHA
jgi:NAD(P)-dependent dehydrogenase (short-subunit alcohol dehydrogenase family)